MASRFGQRDTRPSLFTAYESSRDRAKSESPYHNATTFSHRTESGLSRKAQFSAYPDVGSISIAGSSGQFRSATPNKRGQYSDSVLSELESQNDDQLEGMSAKVKILKDITIAIGDEIRDSTAIAEKMNDSFENTRLRLRGTMNRMLKMAEKTGVGWKVWLGFFAAVILLFWYVWALK